MPDLAILITQILTHSIPLVGPKANQLLCSVPQQDFIRAMIESVPSLIADIKNDTRNVLLTLVRIWFTLETNKICSKPTAAAWAIQHLPTQYHPLLQRAKAICKGQEADHWQDLAFLIDPCVGFIRDAIKA
jgi:hypothetical protein